MAQNQYKCDVCGKAFDSKEELKEHERMMHSDQYKCDVCGESFASEGELAAHEVSMHPEQQGTPRS